MITKERVEAVQSELVIINGDAEIILKFIESLYKEYAELYRKEFSDILYLYRGTQYVSFSFIEGNYLVYTGNEYWNYGGHEDHREDLPIRFLYTPINELDTEIRSEFNQAFIKKRIELVKKAELKKQADVEKQKTVIAETFTIYQDYCNNMKNEGKPSLNFEDWCKGL